MTSTPSGASPGEAPQAPSVAWRVRRWAIDRARADALLARWAGLEAAVLRAAAPAPEGAWAQEMARIDDELASLFERLDAGAAQVAGAPGRTLEDVLAKLVLQRAAGRPPGWSRSRGSCWTGRGATCGAWPAGADAGVPKARKSNCGFAGLGA